MSILRLDVEELNVETFHTIEEQGLVAIQPYFVEWTGCMSDCSGCGRFCANQQIGEPML